MLMVKKLNLKEREESEWKYVGAFIQILIVAFVLNVLGMGWGVGLLAAGAAVIILRIAFLNGVQYDAKSAPDLFK